MFIVGESLIGLQRDRGRFQGVRPPSNSQLRMYITPAGRLVLMASSRGFKYRAAVENGAAAFWVSDHIFELLEDSQ